MDADLGGPPRAFADIGSPWFDLAEFVLGLPSFADGERSARVIDAVLRPAAQDGAWVGVGEAPTASSSDPPS